MIDDWRRNEPDMSSWAWRSKRPRRVRLNGPSDPTSHGSYDIVRRAVALYTQPKQWCSAVLGQESR